MVIGQNALERKNGCPRKTRITESPISALEWIEIEC
jgi:hypothetical protein